MDEIADIPAETQEERRQRFREQRRENLARARAMRGTKKTLGVAPVAVTETAEFRDAVSAAVKAETATIIAELAKMRANEPVSPEVAGDDMGWARKLALALAEISDQGTDRKRVAPELLEQRRIAAEKLKVVLAEVRANGEQPLYQLKNKIQVKLRGKGEAIIEPLWLGNDKIHYPTEISSPDVPNLAMIPINEPAKRIYALFLESIGSVEALELKEPEGLAMTPGGVVVRGNAAQQVARHLGSEWIGHDKPNDAEQFAEVRRNQPSQTRDVRVLGTIAPPARQNA